MELKDHDKKLFHWLEAGCESSYKQLFSEYYVLLSAFAGKYVNDPEKAREIYRFFNQLIKMKIG